MAFVAGSKGGIIEIRDYEKLLKEVTSKRQSEKASAKSKS